MFRKARTHSLASKIQKFMKSREFNVVDTTKIQEGEDRSGEQVWAAYIDAFSKFLIDKLNETQLKTLLKSLECKGGICTDCIIVPSEYELGKNAGLGRSTQSRSDLLFCKVLRWPDIETNSELKRLKNCHAYGGALSCANPYHYSKIMGKDRHRCLQDAKRSLELLSQNVDSWESEKTKHSPEKGFKSKKDDEREERRTTIADCKTDSLSSNMPSRFMTPCSADVSSDPANEPWCSIAYWEINRRVGRIFDVTSETINVFYELPQGDGMCVGLLDQVERNEYIKNIRRHIGFGFQLTLEHDGIWIYNRSDYCIFVSAPLLSSEAISTVDRSELALPEVVRAPEVVRVSPGHCFHVVNFGLIALPAYNGGGKNSSRTFAYQVYCIRVSFAKGWGRNYTRQFITSCPCWAEIYLREPCLALIGQV